MAHINILSRVIIYSHKAHSRSFKGTITHTEKEKEKPVDNDLKL